jgi:NitT/TauT family transport system ATP-binding protein
LIIINNISKKFDNKIIFDNFYLPIEENQITSILGPSGIGKTTLLKLITGLANVDSGNIEGLEGKAVSYIFQETRLIPWFTVSENIDFVLMNKFKKEDREQITNKVLSIVEMSHTKNLYPDELSGGMKQRLSIARAFAYPSDILLMDEPFKGLDIKLKESILTSFKNLWKENRKTVIFVTHDLDESLLLSKYIYLIDEEPAKIIFSTRIDSSIFERNPSSSDYLDIKTNLINKISNK